MRRTALLLVPLAFAATSAARADEGARARADALFREGRGAANAGDWATACSRFEQSQALDPSTGTQLNLGDCMEHLGKWAQARGHFRDAVLALPATDPRLVPAKQRLSALDAKLPWVTVEVAQSAEGATVSCDGRALGRAELAAPLALDPGEHTLTMIAPGHATEKRTVTLTAGAHERVPLAWTVESAPPAPSAPPATPAPVGPPTHDTARTVGWVVGGVGAAGLAVAAVSGLVVMHEKSVADGGCTNKGACSPDALSAVDANKTWLPVNTVAWIVGALGVGVGTYLVLSNPRRPAVRVGATFAPHAGIAMATVELP